MYLVSLLRQEEILNVLRKKCDILDPPLATKRNVSSSGPSLLFLLWTEENQDQEHEFEMKLECDFVNVLHFQGHTRSTSCETPDCLEPLGGKHCYSVTYQCHFFHKGEIKPFVLFFYTN